MQRRVSRMASRSSTSTEFQDRGWTSTSRSTARHSIAGRHPSGASPSARRGGSSSGHRRSSPVSSTRNCRSRISPFTVNRECVKRFARPSAIHQRRFARHHRGLPDLVGPFGSRLRGGSLPGPHMARRGRRGRPGAPCAVRRRAHPGSRTRTIAGCRTPAHGCSLAHFITAVGREPHAAG
jgi:hypothetical protein